MRERERDDKLVFAANIPNQLILSNLIEDNMTIIVLGSSFKKGIEYFGGGQQVRKKI